MNSYVERTKQLEDDIYVSRRVKRNVRYRQDDLGCLIIPLELELKSGWGLTREEAIQHFLERNNLTSK